MNISHLSSALSMKTISDNANNKLYFNISFLIHNIT